MLKAESATASNRRLPERIGPYEIVRELGSGGMAQTFEAVRRKAGAFEKRVCVKRVLYPHSADPGFREEFLQEARVLAQLNHVGIVDAYDYDEDDGHWYLVMELVDGIDFAKLLDHYSSMGRRMPPHVAAYVVARAARALHYLHTFVDANGVALNIIHRDVSPQNILISRYGYVKLSDLGIASFLGRPKLTQTDHTKGKLHYMSPEHIEKHRGLEARSDLFSLGAVLYEALAGTTPFRQPTQIGTHHAILEGKFEPLLACAPNLDPELADLVERTLSPDKDERPTSCLEFAVSLQTLAPHPDPEAALAAGVAHALEATASPGRDTSSTYFTGDPLQRALEVASAFRDPARLTAADTAVARGRARPPHTGELASSASASVPHVSTPRAQPEERRGEAPRKLRMWTMGSLALVATIALGIYLANTRPAAQATVSGPVQRAASAENRPLTDERPTKPPALIAPAQAEPSAPAPSASVEAVAPPAAAVNEPSTNESAPSDKSSKRKGTTGAIKVRVINWGYVWIDGVFRGKSPVLADKLAPGYHEVGAAQVTDRPARTERVRVGPGGYVEHVIRLNDNLFD